MKQAKVKLPSGEYLIQEVHNRSKDFEIKIMVSMPHLFYHYPEPYYELLEPGSWQLLGADPTALTEVEAGEIVEVVSIVKPGVSWYQDYVYSSDAYPTALDSLDSLAASLQISKPFVVLKNIEK